MSSTEPTPESTPTSDSEDAPKDGNDDSVVSPPAYPAYSTPPPEGLATGEDG
ncbi:hypothetical protein H7J50_16270 [Mycobacterium intermedium]|uniref:Uncharacterized protein n=1 Tax=Mycobacterium bourgelatii TaxID=1273442 RepID=A0A7I9YKT8_MYCBU|nr:MULTISPECIES: hypothetical protein [Mycobacterium]MCV6965347.1 hypothetical protein [Mycobacterium intermedium]MCV6975726.1 hypothetical protein [Mycobacterium bourgelatii]GFG89291.1 hypothetical protein MBOU_13330 [Mycobacterium bourgelatii]